MTPGLNRPAATVVKPAPPPTAGSIYSVGSFRPMFENRRARLVGDILTVNIAENTSASQKSNQSLDRKGAVSGGITALPFVSNGSLGRAAIEGGSQNTFEGKGETGSNNDFTGTITVTVIDVLRSGNLLVSGEKQVGLNGNVDVLRFSGVVSPQTISANNTVYSTQVAEARLDLSGRGTVRETQVVGWLARFFMNFLPI